MADSASSPQVLHAQVAIATAAGTAIAVPQSVTVALGDSWLHRVQIDVPKGPNGALGLAVALNGVVIVPWASTATWLILDDDDLTFEVGTEVDRGLTVRSYNIGRWPHTAYFRFSYTPMVRMNTGGPIALDLG